MCVSTAAIESQPRSGIALVQDTEVQVRAMQPSSSSSETATAFHAKAF